MASKDDKRAADLFDLRRIIAGLFIVYGLILTVVGLLDGKQEVAQAAGLRINLIAGLGMLALGIFFAAWALLRPLGRQLEETDGDE